MRAALVALLALAACTPPQPAVRWHPPVELARGGGTKGPWQQNESRFDYVDDPSVALAADGTACVVWVDHRDKDVHFVRVAPDGTRSAAVNVSRTPAVFSWLPRIVVHDRDVFVLWQEIIFSGGSHGGDILFARSRDGGATFESPQNLSASIGGDGKARIDAQRWHNGSLDLVRAPSGMLHAAWTEYDGALWYASSADGTAFTAPVHVAGTFEVPARAPSLAADAHALYLAWTVGERTDADIRVARFANGRFGAPMIVARTPAYADAPMLALANGTLHLAYAESRGGPFDTADVVYTRLAGDRFAPPRTIGEGAFPTLAVDGERIAIVYEPTDHRGLLLAIGSAPPRMIAGSRDPEGINGSHQGRLMRRAALRGDDGGAVTIAVVTSALAHGKHSRVWLLRGDLRVSR